MSKGLLNVLGAVQKALIGNVTPNLRAVYLIINSDCDFELIFYYNNNLSEEEEELPSLVDTEFMSDFPSPTFITKFTIKILPQPQVVPNDGFCVYKRYERK